MRRLNVASCLVKEWGLYTYFDLKKKEKKVVYNIMYKNHHAKHRKEDYN